MRGNWFIINILRSDEEIFICQTLYFSSFIIIILDDLCSLYIPTLTSICASDILQINIKVSC